MYYIVLHEFWNNKKYDAAVSYSVKSESNCFLNNIPTFVNDTKFIKWHTSRTSINATNTTIYTK